MILFDQSNSEAHPAYQALAISNGERQFSFLQSIIEAALATNQTFLSRGILAALNFHAIACLHTNAGEYRPCEVNVLDGTGAVTFRGVERFKVETQMEQLINITNNAWHHFDPISLAALVLWRLCAIHPFINGNGRTARAACYYVVCVRMGGLLPGKVFLPALLKQSPEYVPALQAADDSARTMGRVDLSVLHGLITRLLAEQMASAAPVFPETGAS